MRKLLFFLSLAIVFALTANISFAQPKPVEKAKTKVSAAPATFTARYDGGLFGYAKKQDGSLKFDELNQRMVFMTKDSKELFAFTYDSLMVIYPSSQSVTPTAATVGSYIPLPGAGLLGLIKSKRPYLVVQFTDAQVEGISTANFRLENKELLASVLQSMAEKAELEQRGDAYFRPRKRGTSSPIQ